MLSRGEISLRDLRKVLYPALAIEGILSFLLGMRVFTVWLLIVVWTLFMLKEFFVPVFLNRRIGLYLVSHQLLVPIMTAFPIMQRSDLCSGTREWEAFAVFSLATMCLTMTYEIARKTWSKDREKENADSYTKEWGIARTIMITFAIASIAFAVFTYFLFSQGKHVPIVVNSVLFLLFIIAEIIFIIKKNSKASKIVEFAGILYMIGVFVNVAIAHTF
jgi:4-hydroxybenzoate polyprenyltransferase